MTSRWPGSRSTKRKTLSDRNIFFAGKSGLPKMHKFTRLQSEGRPNAEPTSIHPIYVAIVQIFFDNIKQSDRGESARTDSTDHLLHSSLLACFH